MGWENVLDEMIDLKRWWPGPDGLGYAQNFAQDLLAKHAGASSELRAGFTGFINREVYKLDLADPVWIAPAVCDLINAAREADPPFQPEALLPSDLPAVRGYMRYEHPMLAPDARGNIVNLAAIAWMPVVSADWTENNDGPAPWDQQGIHVTLYSDLTCEEDEGLIPLRDDPEWTQRMVMLQQFTWWFGRDFDDKEYNIGETQDAEVALTNQRALLATMQITFRICQQKIVSSGRTRLPKMFRRRAEREGFDPYTKLITLRRYESTGAGSDVEPGTWLSHRFIVGGHWRNQWYPSLQEHRQLWIHAYIKGPEDAELIIKPNRAVEVVR